MNATVHAQLSVKRRGGVVSDWYAFHDFFDCSKEVESSNAHRIMLHSIWAIKQVIIPIFGAEIRLTGGGTANAKDAGESDHICADYHDIFLPALSDYVALVRDDPSDADLIRQFDHENAAFYREYPQVREHMLSPLANTGALKSLLITHNSWWLNHIIPKVFPGVPVQLKDFNIAPSVVFNRMTYADWLNNGRGSPPSFAKINEHRKRKASPAPRAPSIGDVVYDGKRGGVMPDVVLDGSAVKSPAFTDNMAKLEALMADESVGRILCADGDARDFTVSPVSQLLPFRDGETATDLINSFASLPKPDHLID